MEEGGSEVRAWRKERRGMKPGQKGAEDSVRITGSVRIVERTYVTRLRSGILTIEVTKFLRAPFERSKDSAIKERANLRAKNVHGSLEKGKAKHFPFGIRIQTLEALS